MAFTSTRPPRLFSLKEVAEFLGVSTKTVRRKITAGDLLSHRIGGRLRVSEDDYRSYVGACREWNVQSPRTGEGGVQPCPVMSLTVRSKK